MGMAGHHHGEWKWLGDGKLRAQDADEGLGHIVPISVFNRVFATLMILTIITVAASRVDFGEMNTVIAIAIASVKAMLVVLFFMHLKFEKKLIILYSIYPLILLVLLIGGSVLDVADREHPLPAWKSAEDLLAKPAPAGHHDAGAAHGSAGEPHRSAGGEHGAAAGHGSGHPAH